MDSNTHSTSTPAGLGALVAELQGLAAQDPDRLADAARAERVLVLQGLVERLEGQWLAELAAVDARGAAGAEQGLQAGSTAAWLRHRLRMSPGTAASLVRTARALYRGPLTQTGQALSEGTISTAHAQVLAHGTHDLPAHLAAEAEPVLLQAARRLDPPRLRRVLGHLREVADPDTAQDRVQRQHQQRGLWLSPTWEGMVALQGLLEPEAGQTLLAALEPLARPHDAHDTRTAGQRRADALAELARRTLEAGHLPQGGGVRPQLTVTVDLDSLLGHPGLGGEAGGVGRWRRRPAGGWPATAPSPGSWSPATGPTPATTPAATTTSPASSRRWRPGSRRPLVAPRPSRWRSAAPAGSSRPPNAPPWPSATAPSPTATGPRAGVRPIICATGSTAAPPTWRIWPGCAGPIIARSMRAAGGSPAALMAG
jgi:hypothetical protein